MTLMVALKVKDGIVMAADGQELIPTGSGVIRAHVEKIQKLGDSAAWGGAGDVTFIQRARQALRECVASVGDNSFTLPAQLSAISDAIVDVASELLDQANATASQGERDSPTEERKDVPMGELLFADFTDGKARVYQIDSQGFEVEVEARFAAIGIADAAAYALLRPFDDRDLASMSSREATLLAYGMIKDAIEVSGDVGEPIQVWIIDTKGARQVVDSNEPDGEHSRVRDLWQEYSQSCKSRFADLVRG